MDGFPSHLPGYRRKIRIDPAPGVVRAGVEDDFHHFLVEMEHAEGRITAVRTTSIRVPWTTCPAAGPYLEQRMIGAALADVATEDAKQHCTHQFDLFELAAAHALDDAPTVIDIFVGDPIQALRRAEVRIDGEVALAWTMKGTAIEGGPLHGYETRRMADWIGVLAPEQLEAARALRRGLLVAAGRLADFSQITRATDFAVMKGACYTFQPERAADALPIKTTKLDFSDRPESLLKEETP